MSQEARTPVKFGKPPLVEVACGVTFSLPESLKSAHFGAFWAKISEKFPTVQDAQPLVSLVEIPGQGTSTTLKFELTDMPPLRRAWFLSSDEHTLVQLQEDRFLFNWRKTTKNGQVVYPSFEKVASEFYEQWGQFKAFLLEMKLGEPTITQLELAYVNALIDLDGLDGGARRVLVDHELKIDAGRFLPEPEGFNWHTSYVIPFGVSRLHIGAQLAREASTHKPTIRLDLTARGLPEDTSPAGIESWFGVAHDWITFGFADVTSSESQYKLWERSA